MNRACCCPILRYQWREPQPGDIQSSKDSEGLCQNPHSCAPFQIHRASQAAPKIVQGPFWPQLGPNTAFPCTVCPRGSRESPGGMTLPFPVFCACVVLGLGSDGRNSVSFGGTTSSSGRGYTVLWWEFYF